MSKCTCGNGFAFAICPVCIPSVDNVTKIKTEPYTLCKAEKVRKEMESDKEAKVKAVAEAIDNAFDLYDGDVDMMAKAAIKAYEAH